MRLYGWHRLWVVLCVVLMMTIAAGLFVFWPTTSSVIHVDSFESELTDEARLQLAAEGDETGIHVRMPNGHIVALKKDIDPTTKVDAVSEYSRILEREASKQRLKAVLVALGTWLAACLLLLASGHATAWVIQGFRAGNNAP